IGAGGERGPPLGRRARIGAAAAALIAALVLFAPTWISARLTSWAKSHPGSASTDLRWARRLDPLSLDPVLAEYSLASSPQARVKAARRAVDKEPDWVVPHYLLGLAYLADGRKGP